MDSKIKDTQNKKQDGGRRKEKKTHPNISIQIKPVGINFLTKRGFVSTVVNLLPTIHIAARFKT